jgi:cell wall-associated NlpC family hydrolase
MDNFIGIPYKDKGRTYKSCDCWGLVMLYYRDVLKTEIPDVSCTAESPRKSFASYLNQISKYWNECTPKKNCVVAMATNENHPKLVTHFGIMLDEKRLLHTYKKTQSHISSIDDIQIKNTIKGFYEWRY